MTDLSITDDEKQSLLGYAALYPSEFACLCAGISPSMLRENGPAFPHWNLIHTMPELLDVIEQDLLPIFRKIYGCISPLDSEEAKQQLSRMAPTDFLVDLDGHTDWMLEAELCGHRGIRSIRNKYCSEHRIGFEIAAYYDFCQKSGIDFPRLGCTQKSEWRMSTMEVDPFDDEAPTFSKRLKCALCVWESLAREPVPKGMTCRDEVERRIDAWWYRLDGGNPSANVVKSLIQVILPDSEWSMGRGKLKR